MGGSTLPKVLLVDDDEMNRDSLSRLLRRRGFEVVIGVDGAEAVRLAEAESPDLILMDMSLPIIDGAEATRQIRANAATSSVRIIALTAHAQDTDRARALSIGCDDFDTKPIDLDSLIPKMTALLARE
jgi:CheY-like chemotaxis protein